MSMWRSFVALRWRIIRHGPHDERGFSLVAGLIVAIGVVILAVLIRKGTLDQGWLTVAVTIVGLLWFLGPILLPGSAPVLNVHWFRTLPHRPLRIAVALAPSEVLSVGPVITAAALTSFLVLTAGHGGLASVVAVLAAAAQLYFLLWLGRCTAAVVARLLRSRAGVWIAAVQMSALLAVSFAGWVPIAAYFLPDLGAGSVEVQTPASDAAVPAAIERVLLALPTGWGLAGAVAATGAGSALTVVLPILGLLAAGTVLCGGWTMLAAASIRQPPARVQSNVTARARRMPLFIASGPTSAVTVRELKTWFRDPQRSLELRHAWLTPLLMVALVAPTDWSWGLPFVGVMAAALAAMAAVNTYALDGTALWQLLTTPGAIRADVRGRQVAWLLLLGLPVLIGTILLCLVSPDLWAVAFGAALTATGAACAASPLLSALMPAIGADARDRVSTGQNAGNAAGGQMTAFTVVLAGAVLPGVIAQALGLGSVWLAHLVLGAGLGVLMIVGLQSLTQKRLERSGLELVSAMTSS